MVDLLIVLALAGMFFAIPFLFGYAGMRIIGGSNAFNLGIIAATATMAGCCGAVGRCSSALPWPCSSHGANGTSAAAMVLTVWRW
jgi:hypothetical protein